jgi:hypothetical protein
MKAVTENAAFPESYVVEIDGKIEFGSSNLY